MGLAAVGKAREVGVSCWLDGLRWAEEYERDMSAVVLKTIEEYGPMIRAGLFASEAPEVGILASHVRTPAAAEVTQGDGAKRLGRKLLLMLMKGSNEWLDENISGHMFWNRAGAEHRLTDANFNEVAYASTRMMHAWRTPAWIDGQPYIDGSYLKLVPDDEVRSRISGPMVAIGTEPGGVLKTFAGTVVDDESTILISPDQQLSELGVDFQTATVDGTRAVYELGYAKGVTAAEKLDLVST